MADDLTTEIYKALCTSYGSINDWRAKLLGLLPLASGAGIFFLLNNSFTTDGKITALKPYLLPIGLVGAIITAGLFLYDIRAIQVRHSLIEAGKAIEEAAKIQGQFSTRPHSYGRITNDLQGSTLIYFAVIAGWLFLGLGFGSLKRAWWVSGIVFVLGVVSVTGIGFIIASNQP
jgi:hypothetical protein